MKFRNLGINCAVLGALLLAATAISARAEDVLRLGHNRTWSNPALILGLTNHDFDRFGVKVVEHEFTSPANIITAIASGDLDAGAAPGGSLFSAVERGVKAKGVAVLQGSNNPPIAFTVRSDSGIKSVKDLRGKTAGVNNYGGNYDIYLRYWLERGGLNPEKDVNIIVVPVPSLVPSLINKQVDLVPLAAFDQAIVTQRYPGKTRTLFTYDDVMQAGTGKHQNNGIILVMADAFIAKHHAVAVKFLEGYLTAIRAMNADTKKAVGDWAAAVNNNALRNLSAPPTVPENGKIYLAALQFDADQALHFGYLKKPLDVRTVVDSHLLDEAATALK